MLGMNTVATLFGLGKALQCGDLYVPKSGWGMGSPSPFALWTALLEVQ